MITGLDLRNFKGHRRTGVRLGRFTMLVGDNASGKSSVLEALAILGGLASGPVPAMTRFGLAQDIVRRSQTRMRLSATSATGGSVRLEIETADDQSHVSCSARLMVTRDPQGTSDPAVTWVESGGAVTSHSAIQGGWRSPVDVVGTISLFSLDATRVARGDVVADPAVVVAADGANTGSILAALRLAEDPSYEKIQASLRLLVPSVERFSIRQHADGGRVVNRIVFDFIGAPKVPASGASRGTLVVLAILAILHQPRRPNVILLDDFDHALHPRAQMELVRTLRTMLAMPEFADLQVVATTHSPYVLDEMALTDVHVFALASDGTVRTKPLAAHPQAAATKGTLTPGQLWSLDPERSWVVEE
jgi:predicted ATPase